MFSQILKLMSVIKMMVSLESFVLGKREDERWLVFFF